MRVFVPSCILPLHEQLTTLFSGGPGIGLYCATKHTIRALSDSLNQELNSIAPELRSIIFELGYFRTSFLTASNRAPYEPRIADYAAAGREMDTALTSLFSCFLPWPGRGADTSAQSTT